MSLSKMGLAALFISISGLMTSFLLNMVMGNEESSQGAEGQVSWHDL
ncbi:hypothetical protein [Rossellomorea aquimaris]|nr:hypothetical protein [Rossellomorea aquimaris]